VFSEKMAPPGAKSFCVLEYHTNKSVVTVQSAFRSKYAKDPPTAKIIRAWYKQFTETGCLYKQKAPMLTRVWQELEYHIDVCPVACGAQTEHLYIFNLPYISVNTTYKFEFTATCFDLTSHLQAYL
jgi:hypothetical protein